MNEKQQTILITLRLPEDIVARLPKPARRGRRAGAGRSAAIVKLLRQALNEQSQSKAESSR